LICDSTIFTVSTTSCMTARSMTPPSTLQVATLGSFLNHTGWLVPPHGRASAVSCCPGTATVARDAGERDGGRDRRDVDDRTAAAGGAAGPHRAEGVLEAQRRPEDVDLQHPAYVSRVEVGDQTGDLDPGVVDDDVQPAQLGDRLRDGRFPARVLGHVERDEPGGGTGLPQRLGRRLAQLLLDVADDDGGTGPGKGLGHPGTQSASTARHQCLASGQVVHTHGTSPH
jgi:hypothetical protein